MGVVVGRQEQQNRLGEHRQGCREEFILGHSEVEGQARQCQMRTGCGSGGHQRGQEGPEAAAIDENNNNGMNLSLSDFCVPDAELSKHFYII